MNGIAETQNGYVLVGWGRLGGYYSEASAVMVKLNTDGTVQWSKTFGPPEFWSEIAFDSVSSTADGGYIVRGHRSPTYGYGQDILVKFTSNGQVLWSKAFFDETTSSFSQPVSDGLILGVKLIDDEPGIVWLVKVNDSSNIVWKKFFAVNGFSLRMLAQAFHNGVVLAGKSLDSNELILIGLNANGELQWRATYLLKVPDFDISGVAQTSDRGYVITGTMFDPNTYDNRNGFVLRIDARRNLIFEKFFGFSDQSENAGPAFANSDGSFTVFGSSGVNDDMLILKLNSNGNVPGCTFLHKLTVEKVQSPDVKSTEVTIVPDVFSLPGPKAMKVTSVKSGERATDACP